MSDTVRLSDLQLSTLLESALFEGVDSQDALAMLSCLGAVYRECTEGETVVHTGTSSTKMGVVLSGSVIMQRTDVHGGRTIMGRAAAAETFGEAFACSAPHVYGADVVAATDCELLLLDVNRVLATCTSACTFHARLVRNLLTTLANRNLALSKKIACVAPRTIRERVLAYLAELPADARGRRRTPFTRQQLADYLCVDRSALSHEISKMKASGMLDYDGNEFWF